MLQKGNSQNMPLPMYFDHLTIQEGLSHNTVYSILQDQYGYIWIGTQNGLNRYDGYDLKVYRSADKLSDNQNFVGKNILALYEDRAGNIWVGTRKAGINIRKRISGKFVNLQEEEAFAAMKGFAITSFYEDQVGNIWISTIGAGLFKYQPDEKTVVQFTSANSGLLNDHVFDMLEDQYGVLWVATAGKGMNYLQKNGQFASCHEDLSEESAMNGYRKTLLLDGEYLDKEE